MNRTSERVRLNKLIVREGMSSLMSDTKWMRLIDGLRAVKLPLKYRFKLLEAPDVSEWFMEETFGQVPEPYIEPAILGPFIVLAIEWLEIDSLAPWAVGSIKGRHRLIPTDYSSEVKALLENVNAPYSREGNVFKVLGHVRHNLPDEK